MFALKYLLKVPFSLLKNANGRKLLKLMWQYGDIERHKPKLVKFNGLQFQVPDCMSFLFQFKEIFFDLSYKFASSNSKPVIIDCGANIGTSCAFFKTNYPEAKIIAFEADPQIANILKTNIEKNGLTNIQIIPKAAWITNDGIEFVTEGSDSASIYGSGAKIKVESIRLRDILEKENQVDMLKIDIEGAEYEVIKDCSPALKNVKNIFIEYHSFPNQPQNLGEIINILTESGFRYYINSANDRSQPLINHLYEGNEVMDLQLNIFGYRT